MPLTHSLAEQARERENLRSRKPQPKKILRPTTEAESALTKGFLPVFTRVQSLTLSALGWKGEAIESYLGVKKRTAQSIFQRAKQRGFDPSTKPPLIL